jgi:Cu+-exporting ATPase
MRRFVPSLVLIISVLITMPEALTAADVMGSGSDIALASAKFILLSPNLHGQLILTDLSRKVFRRIKFNFVSRSFTC